jgi:hypothetical protein
MDLNILIYQNQTELAVMQDLAIPFFQLQDMEDPL